MRILHTADWHLGRSLEGNSRLSEQEEFIEELCEIVSNEDIDLILIAGDIFDSVNPPAKAEELFYYAIERLSNNGQRTVVGIAGNHDNPERLCAANPLAIHQGVYLLGMPADIPAQSRYGKHRLIDRDISYLSYFSEKRNELVKLFALPYPSEMRLNELLTKFSDEQVPLDEKTLQQSYVTRINSLFNAITNKFTDDAICISMSHLFMAGSQESQSERPISVGGAYTIPIDVVPLKSQYFALGHLHRAQTLKGTSVPTRYAGSPLAYSFSESMHAKSVTVIDIKPGSEAIIKEIHLSCGKPLVRWVAKEGISQVEEWISKGRDKNAWVELEIHLDDILTPEQLQRIRAEHPGLLNIIPVFKSENLQMELERRDDLPIDQLFIQFYSQQTGGATPDKKLVTLFTELLSSDAESTPLEFADEVASSREEEK